MSDTSDPDGGPPYIVGATSEELPSSMTDVSHVIAYETEDGELPGGMKARYVVTVVTGQRARELDARQAEAIWEVLKWARDHPEEPGKGQKNAHGSARKSES